MSWNQCNRCEEAQETSATNLIDSSVAARFSFLGTTSVPAYPFTSPFIRLVATPRPGEDKEADGSFDAPTFDNGGVEIDSDKTKILAIISTLHDDDM